MCEIITHHALKFDFPDDAHGICYLKYILVIVAYESNEDFLLLAWAGECFSARESDGFYQLLVGRRHGVSQFQCFPDNSSMNSFVSWW